MTGKPEVARQPTSMTPRSMRAEIINHVKEKSRGLSWYSGDQLWQLMLMLNARYCRDALVHLLRRIAIMSEDQTMSSCEYRVDCEFFDWVQVAMTTCTNSESRTHWNAELWFRVARARQKLVELSLVDRDRASSHDEGEAQ